MKKYIFEKQEFRITTVGGSLILCILFSCYLYLGVEFEIDYSYLYYFPIFLGSIFFGLKGGILIALTSTILYVSFTISLQGAPLSYKNIDLLFRVLGFNIAGIVLGKISDESIHFKEELSKRIKELTYLFEVSRAIISSIKLDKLLDTILDSLLRIIGAKRGSLLLLDEETGEMRIKAARGLGEEIQKKTVLKLGQGISGKVAETGKPVLVKNIEKDPRFRRKSELQYESKSFLSFPLLCAPLGVRGRIKGVINISDKAGKKEFEERDLELVSILGSQAAIAIENASLYGELEEKISTLEKMNRELKETQEQLIRSAKLASMGELAAGVAHEIDNPLSVISGNIQLLLNKIEKGDSSREELGIIQRASERCGKIVESLLEYSRISQYKVEPLNVNELIEETLSLVEYQTSLQNIDIKKHLDPQLPQVKADADRIRQVFLNLLLNAKDAMSQGGELTLTTKKEGKFVEIEFKDTGCGIPEEDIPKLFNPFFSTKEKGTGLGLSVSQRIMENHRGDIRVRGKLGEGSVFTVVLPALSAHRQGDIYA
jgi:signal transduction histidine kinase